MYWKIAESEESHAVELFCGFFSCRIALKILSIIALTDRGNTNSICFQNVEISANTQLTALDILKR